MSPGNFVNLALSVQWGRGCLLIFGVQTTLILCRVEYNIMHWWYSFNLIFSSSRDEELKDIPNGLQWGLFCLLVDLRNELLTLPTCGSCPSSGQCRGIDKKSHWRNVTGILVHTNCHENPTVLEVSGIAALPSWSISSHAFGALLLLGPMLSFTKRK